MYSFYIGISVKKNVIYFGKHKFRIPDDQRVICLRITIWPPFIATFMFA